MEINYLFFGYLGKVFIFLFNVWDMRIYGIIICEKYFIFNEIFLLVIEVFMIGIT